MANTTPTPFRNRPNLHLSLSQLSGSPRATGSAARLSLGTPLATTTYSPFRSAGLKPPTPYGGPMTFAPRNERRRYYETHSWYRYKRILSSKSIWFLLALVALTVWWFHGGRDEISTARLDAKRLRKDLFSEGWTKDLQFFPASNPKIHVRKLLSLDCVLELIVCSTLGDGLQRRTGYARMGLFQVLNERSGCSRRWTC